jgi:hypothetical protein
MKYQTLSQKLAFSLYGLWLLGSLCPTTALAGDCAIADPAKADSWKACEGKPIKVTGTRAAMDDVPPTYAAVDPSFTGGKGFQDYMTFDKKTTYVILRTTTSVECAEQMEVEGTLKYIDVKGEKDKVRDIEVTKMTCK